MDLARQANRVFMYTFMVPTFHSGGERNRGFSKTIAEFVGRGQCPRPSLLGLRIQQIELALLVIEAGCLYAQQPNPGTGFPIVPEELADLRKDLVVELGAARRRMSAGDGVKVGGAEL